MSNEDSKECYNLLWGLEDNIKVMKCRLLAENFSGKTVKATYQDFHAKILTHCVGSTDGHGSHDTVSKVYAHREHRKHVNFTAALSKS